MREALIHHGRIVSEGGHDDRGFLEIVFGNAVEDVLPTYRDNAALERVDDFAHFSSSERPCVRHP